MKVEVDETAAPPGAFAVFVRFWKPRRVRQQSLARGGSARDAGAGVDHPYWGEPVALDGMVDAVEAILIGPATPA